MVRRTSPSVVAVQAASAAIEAKEDPEVFRPHQLEWFAKVVQKDLKFYFIYVLAFAALVCFTPTPPSLDVVLSEDNNYQVERCIATFVFAVVGVFTLWVDIFRSTAAEPGDRKWHLLQDGFGGHFCYLTVNILTAWAVYWPLCFLAELAVLVLDPQDALVHRVLVGMYQCAVFSSSLGTLLTMLFLKFNWFEPTWRKEVLAMYDARGNTTFRKKILFTHLNQLPIAFLDVAVLKRGAVLQYSTPNLPHLLAICLVYTASYIAFTHANYQYSRTYPYSFMDVVFKTWGSEFGFLFGLTAFCFLVSAAYHWLAFV